MTNVLHLSYHYVREGAAPGAVCTPNRLRNQIQSLKSNGYELMTCGDVVRRYIDGAPLPEKYATLSFDDGLKDQFLTAFPILQEYRVPATFFYTTCALDEKLPAVIGFQILIQIIGEERMREEVLPDVFKGTPYLDLLDEDRYNAAGRKMGEPEGMRRMKWMFNHWPSQSFKQEKIDEIFSRYVGENSQEKYAREWFMSTSELCHMAAEGMEIASHTVTHPALDVTGLAEMEMEFAVSKKKLEEVTGREIDSFAWTFGGHYRSGARRLVKKYYRSAWNLRTTKDMPEMAYSDCSDIPRILESAYL